MAHATAAAATTPKSRTAGLRELGIYTLPDGREYIVSTLYSDGCCLYQTAAWDTYGDAEFWVDKKDGLILRRGSPTPWSARDLKDTGRTARYPKPILR